MTLEEKLNEYAEIPSNLDLENTMRERNGVPIILCVPLDEAILICKQEIESACKKQREICAKEIEGWVISNTYKSIYNVILNAPSPEGEMK